MKISAQKLARHFRDADNTLRVLENVNVEFEAGKSYAIVGRSGIGKSTLLHLLAGLEKPTSGEIYFDNLNLSNLTADQLADFRAKNIGIVYQFHHLLPEFTALENVAMPLILQAYSNEEAENRAGDILAKVGLAGRLSHFPGQLSGGEQQRVALARAMVANPGVIFADEPTGSLDVATGQEVCDLLASLVKETGTSLIVATHSKDFAERMDHVLEMSAGGELKWI